VTTFKAIVRKFVRDETGATMVEYGLMLALIAVVCLGAVALVGTNAAALFNQIAGSL
jgi:pilus assembly protein Flp/PilA